MQAPLLASMQQANTPLQVRNSQGFDHHTAVTGTKDMQGQTRCSISLVTPMKDTVTSTLENNFTDRPHTCGHLHAKIIHSMGTVHVIHSMGTWRMHTVPQTISHGCKQGPTAGCMYTYYNYYGTCTQPAHAPSNHEETRAL